MNNLDPTSVNINNKTIEENFRAVKSFLDNMVDVLNAQSIMTEKNIDELTRSVQDLSRQLDESVTALNARIARLEQ